MQVKKPNSACFHEHTILLCICGTNLSPELSNLFVLEISAALSNAM